jgi:hypothetical protein
MKRLDTAKQADRQQVYAIDVKHGMLTATIMDAPVFGNKLLSYDEGQAMPGVRASTASAWRWRWWPAPSGRQAIDQQLDPKWGSQQQGVERTARRHPARA